MNANETTVKMVLDSWNALLKQFDTALNTLSDEQLLQEIAPTKNRGIYVLGHLIAVNDAMLVLLDLGDKLYPELYEPFIKNLDKSVKELPSAANLRGYWKQSFEIVTQKLSSLQPNDWFQKHTAVSTEDFEKEPHRNKLNILLTRTCHVSYHLGQLVLLK